MRLGAGLGAGLAWAQAGRAAGALARRWAAGRAGARRACVCARTGAQGVWRAAGA